MHLRPRGRVQAVGGDQQPAVKLHLRAARGANAHCDAIAVVAITDDALPHAHRAGPEALGRRAEEQHLQAAAVHRVLRPAVTGEQAARLGVNVLAVQADERPLPGR
jgi:hypothetical protein